MHQPAVIMCPIQMAQKGALHEQGNVFTFLHRQSLTPHISFCRVFQQAELAQRAADNLLQAQQAHVPLSGRHAGGSTLRSVLQTAGNNPNKPARNSAAHMTMPVPSCIGTWTH